MNDVTPEQAVENPELGEQWQIGSDDRVRIKPAKLKHVFRTWDVITVNKHHTVVCYLIILLLTVLVFQFRADARYYYERSLKEIPFYFVKDWYGETVTLKDMPPPIWVYRFASAIWTRVQTCATNCAEDFPQNLVANSPFFTVEGYREVEELLKKLNRKSQLQGVRRSLVVDPDYRFNADSVIDNAEGDGWRVKLVFRLTETLSGTIIKDMVPIEYNLIIVPMNVDRTLNDQGLGIAGTEEHLNRRLSR